MIASWSSTCSKAASIGRRRGDAVALVVEQLSEFFDLAILFGDDLVGAGHDLFDFQPPVRRFGVVLIVGIQFRQEPAFLGFPIAAGVRSRRRRCARRAEPDWASRSCR